MGSQPPESQRGLTPIVSIALMTLVVIILAVVVIIGALTFLPEDQSVRPNADFTFEHTGTSLEVRPVYMDNGNEFNLRLNEKQAYTWTGNGATEERKLSCLNEGDTVRITSSPAPRRTYLIEDYTVKTPTDCGLAGSTSRFTYASVDGRKMPLESESYEFSLAIDPNGPNSVNGDTTYSTTNSWNYIEKYDRTVEGLDPPVYVIVFADNVGDWSSEPTESDLDGMATSYSVDASGNVSPTPSGSEPTNDVYMVFQPDCDQSQFLYVDKEASYDNHIYLDGDLLFVDSDTSPETTFSAPGVQCV